jgi:hypothetical protein
VRPPSRRWAAMAARTDPLGWSLRHTLHQSPFEGVPGLLRLHHVQHMFERHASGQGRDRAVNQRAFQAFCEEMGMVNPGARTHAP